MGTGGNLWCLIKFGQNFWADKVEGADNAPKYTLNRIRKSQDKSSWFVPETNQSVENYKYLLPRNTFESEIYSVTKRCTMLLMKINPTNSTLLI